MASVRVTVSAPQSLGAAIFPQRQPISPAANVQLSMPSTDSLHTNSHLSSQSWHQTSLHPTSFSSHKASLQANHRHIHHLSQALPLLISTLKPVFCSTKHLSFNQSFSQPSSQSSRKLRANPHSHFNHPLTQAISHLVILRTNLFGSHLANQLKYLKYLQATFN